MARTGVGLLLAAVALCPAAAARPQESPPSRKPAEAGHTDSCPRECPACDKLFAETLRKLCGEVDRSPAAAPVPVKLAGWSALQVPSCALLGMILLGEGTTTSKGPHSGTLRKLAEYVGRTAGADAPAAARHRTWVLAFGVLFFAELHRASPSEELKRKLREWVPLLESGRHPGQGWHHEPKPVKSTYGPLVAATTWAIAALAAARDQRIKVDEEGLGEAVSTIRKSIGRSGGASYFAKADGLVQVGRAAGVGWCLKRAGAPPAEEIERIRGFMQRHATDAMNGHASAMMSLGQSALFAASDGGELATSFWKIHRKTISDSRQPGGAFPVMKWEDLDWRDANDGQRPPDREGYKWPDPMYGDAWATIWMSLTWQAGRGRSVLATPPDTKPSPKR